MRFLFVSDLHGNSLFWSWFISASNEFDATFNAGDLLPQTLNDRDIPNAISTAQRNLQLLRSPHNFVCSGNHDLIQKGQNFSDAWLTCMDVLPHIHTKGFHTLDGWMIQVCNYLDTADVEAGGPGTILLTHVPPQGSHCSITQHGFSFGDEELNVSQPMAPSIICTGHVHEPRRWYDRLGGMVLNPGVAAPRSLTPNHIIIDTEDGVAVFNQPGREPQSLGIM